MHQLRSGKACSPAGPSRTTACTMGASPLADSPTNREDLRRGQSAWSTSNRPCVERRRLFGLRRGTGERESEPPDGGLRAVGQRAQDGGEDEGAVDDEERDVQRLEAGLAVKAGVDERGRAGGDVEQDAEVVEFEEARGDLLRVGGDGVESSLRTV